MPAIIIPRRRLLQPQGRVDIASEFAGIVAGAVCADQYFDGARWSVVPQQVGQSAVATAYGVGLHTSADVAPFGFTLAQEVSVDNFGIVFCGRSSGGVTGANSAFAWANSDSAFLHMNGSDSVVGVAAMGAAYFSDTVSDDRIPIIGAYVGCYSKTSDSAIYVDGRRVNSGFYGASTANIKSMWVGSRPNAAIRCWRGVSELAATLRIADQGLSAEVSINPWQLFRSDPVRFYSLPSGQVTLGVPSISNITASGFRVSVGLT